MPLRPLFWEFFRDRSYQVQLLSRDAKRHAPRRRSDFTRTFPFPGFSQALRIVLVLLQSAIMIKQRQSEKPKIFSDEFEMDFQLFYSTSRRFAKIHGLCFPKNGP